MLCVMHEPTPPWLLIVTLLCADVALAALTAYGLFWLGWP